jgi:prephenate dehydrogenase
VRPIRVAIVGLGLVGGSLARVLSGRGYRVLGIDTLAVRRRARRSGAVAETCGRLEDGLAGVDLTVLAASPDVNVSLLRRVARVAPDGIVTDVSSVKRPICAEAERMGLAGFVGGHPMAGTENAGFGASRADLFAGRPWALVGGRPAALRRVKRLVRDAGGKPILMDAAEHDRAVAFLSHLPQLVSWALAAAARRDPVASRHRTLAGPGFRDMTRLAGSPPELWREILRANVGEVDRALGAFRRALGAGDAGGRSRPGGRRRRRD